MNNQQLYIISKITPIISFEDKVDCYYIVSTDWFFTVQISKDTFQDRSSCDVSNGSKRKSSCVLNDLVFEEINSIGVSTISEQSGNSKFEFQCLCPCMQDMRTISFPRKMGIELDGLLFSCIMHELRRSYTFRKNMLLQIFVQYKTRYRITSFLKNSLCGICERCLWKIHVLIFLINPKKHILDYKWCKKLQILVNERCELENAMAWLSTLGGAFAALGDSYIHFAEKAGDISIQQLQIALRFGDPITVCRCKIYLAMSLLQRGYFKRTKTMIRESYEFSTKGEGARDFRLKNMCIAVWNKIKYLSSLKKSITQNKIAGVEKNFVPTK